MAGLNHSYRTDPALSHRTGEVTVTVLTPHGEPLAHTDVQVEQTAHAFGFGNIAFEFVPRGDEPPATHAPELVEPWFDLFNYATLPFYWGRFEPERGAPRTAQLRAAAEWIAARGVTVKGHPLLWHTVACLWQLDLPTAEVRELQLARIRRELTDFAGLVTAWDVVNEAVIMPLHTRIPNAITTLAREQGRIETVRMAFAEARATDPNATLLLNDFDMSAAYECLIEGLLEAEVPIDVLGLQSHMHQGYWGEEKTEQILDRFARYGLPLHFTETTLLSGELMPAHIEDLNDFEPASWPSTPEGEERQADEIVRHYRTLLAHPQVEVITYWGLGDRFAWLGAPGGLLREDGSPKPAYEALHALVKGEWWLAPTTLRTDDAGRVTVRGWLGDYAVSLGGASAPFSVVPSRSGTTTAVSVTLPAG